MKNTIIFIIIIVLLFLSIDILCCYNGYQATKKYFPDLTYYEYVFLKKVGYN